MIEQAAIIALIVLFLHACTWDGHIFSFIRKLISEKSAISKPVYNCPICMTPYYGTVIYLLFYRGSVSEWVLTVGAAAGLSVISVVLIHAKDCFVEITKQLKS